jgi:hypothetical protein
MGSQFIHRAFHTIRRINEKKHFVHAHGRGAGLKKMDEYTNVRGNAGIERSYFFTWAYL